jgi:hypothetical protein
MKIEYYEKYTKVYDGYEYTNSEVKQAVKLIIEKRKELGLPVTRTESSYVNEWITHNRLYKLGIEKNRTKDVDLEENIDPKRNFLYSIFGR